MARLVRQIEVSSVWFRSISSRVQVIIGKLNVWLWSSQVIGCEQVLPSLVCSNLQWFTTGFMRHFSEGSLNRTSCIFVLQMALFDVNVHETTSLLSCFFPPRLVLLYRGIHSVTANVSCVP